MEQPATSFASMEQGQGADARTLIVAGAQEATGQAGSHAWLQEKVLYRPCCCCGGGCLVPRWSSWPLCLLTVYMVLLPFLFVLGHFMVYPGDPWEDYDESACKTFTFTAQHNKTLRGIECAHGGEGEEALAPIPAIVFGGNGMNMYSSAAYMPSLLPRSTPWRVFSISFPGDQYAGGTSGWTSMDEALEEAKALLTYVSGQTSQPIVVFGWSLGSSLAAGLVASASQDQVRCLLLGNPFTSMRDMGLSFTLYLAAPYLFLLDKWPTARWVQSVRVPTIVMSSLEDEVVPARMHTTVYNVVAARQKVLIDKEASHMQFRSFTLDAGRYINDWCVPVPKRSESLLQEPPMAQHLQYVRHRVLRRR